ncbi:tetratricopeptide repeat protein [Flagellimonas lutaonensis]|nr:hypothetical protein [Allomuricauda lutaonensis]
MKKKIHFLGVLAAFFIMQGVIYAQKDEQIEVEQSAEVFLDEYTDEFQENFFEALKQKGIQNYDRAANLLLKCKQLKPGDPAIDHELAKVYLLDKKYPSAQQYAIEALHSGPENYWFLNTLLSIIDRQGSAIETVQDRIPYGNKELKQNLVRIYFKTKRFQQALNVLNEMGTSDFKERYLQRINDSIHKPKTAGPAPVVEEETEEDVLSRRKSTIEEAIANNDFNAVESLSAEALEAYPLQPYFYYAQGWALNKQGRPKEAISILETGLDYLFDDQTLLKMIYAELAEAHKTLGNGSKANEYLSKIKSGL